MAIVIVVLTILLDVALMEVTAVQGHAHQHRPIPVVLVVMTVNAASLLLSKLVLPTMA